MILLGLRLGTVPGVTSLFSLSYHAVSCLTMAFWWMGAVGQWGWGGGGGRRGEKTNYIFMGIRSSFFKNVFT